MTSSIPDGLSMDDLQSMFESAVSEEELTSSNDCDDTPEFYTERATSLLQSSIEGLDAGQAVMLHKVMLHMMIDNMIEWHSRVGIHLSEDGEAMSAMGWQRDAGKFQAIANILNTIKVRDDDFTAEAA